MNYAENPRAKFDYNILEKYTAGIVLFGSEVKSIRSGKCSIKGSFVKILGGEAWLIGSTIAPYQPCNIQKDYDEQRSRKLLLRKKELDYLSGKSNEKGLTLIPMRIFPEKGLVKLEFGVGRGKKKYDKRETIKERETKKKISRAMKV